MFAIVKILTNVGVSRWIDKEKDEFKRDMENKAEQHIAMSLRFSLRC